MTHLVTIFGGSGFVGRYIAQRMAKQGWRVRVAVRRPNEAIFVRPYGTVGQVEPVLANIRDDRSVRDAMRGCDAVVNCVGTFDWRGANDFEAVQHQGAARIARTAEQTGVGRMVSVSALGANDASPSKYQRTKAQGEAAVLASMPDAVILRPSVIFGHEDGFFNRFASMSRFGPIVPLIGADTRFQPVYVDDVARAAELAILGKAAGGTYELGGPEVKTLRGWVEVMLGAIRQRRMIVNQPFWAGRLIAGTLDLAQVATFGLFDNSILTRDQVRSLRFDNIVAPDAARLSDLGFGSHGS